jgi:hypothetical protein
LIVAQTSQLEAQAPLQAQLLRDQHDKALQELRVATLLEPAQVNEAVKKIALLDEQIKSMAQARKQGAGMFDLNKKLVEVQIADGVSVITNRDAQLALSKQAQDHLQNIDWARLDEQGEQRKLQEMLGKSQLELGEKEYIIQAALADNTISMSAKEFLLKESMSNKDMDLRWQAQAFSEWLGKQTLTLEKHKQSFFETATDKSYSLDLRKQVFAEYMGNQEIDLATRRQTFDEFMGRSDIDLKTKAQSLSEFMAKATIDLDTRKQTFEETLANKSYDLDLRKQVYAETMSNKQMTLDEQAQVFNQMIMSTQIGQEDKRLYLQEMQIQFQDKWNKASNRLQERLSDQNDSTARMGMLLNYQMGQGRLTLDWATRADQTEQFNKEFGLKDWQVRQEMDLNKQMSDADKKYKDALTRVQDAQVKNDAKQLEIEQEKLTQIRLENTQGIFATATSIADKLFQVDSVSGYRIHPDGRIASDEEVFGFVALLSQHMGGDNIDTTALMAMLGSMDTQTSPSAISYTVPTSTGGAGASTGEANRQQIPRTVADARKMTITTYGEALKGVATEKDSGSVAASNYYTEGMAKYTTDVVPKTIANSGPTNDVVAQALADVTKSNNETIKALSTDLSAALRDAYKPQTGTPFGPYNPADAPHDYAKSTAQGGPEPSSPDWMKTTIADTLMAGMNYLSGGKSSGKSTSPSAGNLTSTLIGTQAASIDDVYKAWKNPAMTMSYEDYISMLDNSRSNMSQEVYNNLRQGAAKIKDQWQRMQHEGTINIRDWN